MPRQSIPQRANLTIEQMQKGVERLTRTIADVSAYDPKSMTERFPPERTALEARVRDAIEKTFPPGTTQYDRFIYAATLGDTSIYLGSPPSVSKYVEVALRRQSESLALLAEAIRSLEEDLTEAVNEARTPASQTTNPIPGSGSVFVVHGHDEGLRETVARYLEKIGFKPIILHEQANQGRTIIEKVEAHADVGFAVVLLSPDDLGGKATTDLKPRARQNVILELGYFIGRLGRDRVCALKKGATELPSDFDGVVYLAVEGDWKQQLAKELSAAGYTIDWNLVMGA